MKPNNSKLFGSKQTKGHKVTYAGNNRLVFCCCFVCFLCFLKISSPVWLYHKYYLNTHLLNWYI